MKFNWGTGIFLFYGLFATGLFYEVYKSTQYDHSLVADDYYAKDLAYQAHYDRKMNSLQLAQPLKIEWEKNNQTLKLNFPENLPDISGKVLLYRPGNKKLDTAFDIRVNDGNQMDIPTDNLAVGRWVVEVEWSSGQTLFYDEKDLYIAP
ncbi:MAG: hypothetical protein D6714_19655 [Bacteroidetes bacterium]|nr:MAG: hypothetical protein D6714_19655 [Bacteroidota bacterium]